MISRLFNELKFGALLWAFFVGTTAAWGADDEEPEPNIPKLPGIFPGGRDLPIRPLPMDPSALPDEGPGGDEGRRSGGAESGRDSTSRSRPDGTGPSPRSGFPSDNVGIDQFVQWGVQTTGNYWGSFG